MSTSFTAQAADDEGRTVHGDYQDGWIQIRCTKAGEEVATEHFTAADGGIRTQPLLEGYARLTLAQWHYNRRVWKDDRPWRDAQSRITPERNVRIET